MRFGIIDLGTNSVRLDIYEMHSDGECSLLSREKIMVRLGEDVYDKGKISKDAQKRTLKAFKHFETECQEWSVEKVNAIATSAMREAKNSDEFAEKVLEETGFKLKVISGKAEATLILRGIEEDDRVGKSVFGFYDIGGGSTEIGVVRGDKHYFLESLPLGAVRLKEMFFEKDYSSKNVGKARKHIIEVLDEATYEKKIPHIELMLGSSGTMRALYRLIEKNEKIKIKALGSLIDELLDATPKEIKNWPGLNPERADIIVPGAILAQELMIHFRTPTIDFTEYALRDGLLFDTIEKNQKKLKKSHLKQIK